MENVKIFHLSVALPEKSQYIDTSTAAPPPVNNFLPN